MIVRWLLPATTKQVYTTYFVCGCLPTFSPSLGCQIDDLSDILVYDVIKLIRCAPSKRSSVDPLPTWLHKKCAKIISSFIASLCNASMKSGPVPKALTETHITSLLKKPTLDSNDINNYRSISILSKLLQRVVYKQLVSYLDVNNLRPRNHRNHSTETKVFFDITSVTDNGNFVLLSLLDLSAAIDCVDHHIFIKSSGHSFDIQSKVPNWITSHLKRRTQYASIRKIIFVLRSYELRCTAGFSHRTTVVPFVQS